MNVVFLIHFLFDPKKGWDRKNWAAEENGRKRPGAGETGWCGCGPPAQRWGQGGEDCVESWCVSIWIIAVSHWPGSLVYLVHRAKQSPRERSFAPQHSLLFPLLFILVAGTHVTFWRFFHWMSFWFKSLSYFFPSCPGDIWREPIKQALSFFLCGSESFT